MGAKKVIELENKAELLRLYIAENWSAKQIADLYKCSESNVNKYLAMHGIRKYFKL